MTSVEEKAKEHFKDKKFFIVEKYVGYQNKRFSIYGSKMYDITTATRKLLALDTLNEDRESYSYHLQEVDFSMVDKPLVLTDEVKDNQEEMPF